MDRSFARFGGCTRIGMKKNQKVRSIALPQFNRSRTAYDHHGTAFVPFHSTVVYTEACVDRVASQTQVDFAVQIASLNAKPACAVSRAVNCVISIDGCCHLLQRCSLQPALDVCLCPCPPPTDGGCPPRHRWSPPPPPSSSSSGSPSLHVSLGGRRARREYAVYCQAG